ncbi:hypothetical protein Tco_1355206 [Tanacetum coccineum]
MLMVRVVSDNEIKDALFFMGDDKAPRPDGFTAAFFKKSWDIVGGEITNAVRDFFSNDKLLKELNHTIITHSESISDNILLMQELMRNYHRKRGPPRCAFKVDIHKAYDMVDWGFLRSILVDDLFLFAKGHPNSVRVIIDALEEFKNVSGLVPSIPKSTAFFCNVLNALKASILSSMSFAKGTLPIKYLGVPLISSRLLYRDCKVLVEKLESRLNDWRNKFLSRAGHLQLLMRGFLWCQGEMKKGKAKVAWEAVCLPYLEGGLGIRRLDDYNVALMTTHVWCILINKESLWVQWIHSYKLKGRSFWDVPCLGDINNGRSTSMWFDRWADSCPLRDMLTVRNIVRSGFSLSNTVSDLISNGAWRWTSCASVPHRLVDVLAFLIPSKGSSVSNVISRIVLAIMTYCLWYERNSRLFNKKKSTANQIVQRITSLVWMKLVMFKFKKMTTGVCCLTNGRFQALILIMIGVLDDLFLFARGHPNSVRVIINALEEFKNVSGLVPSIPKSTAFFCNVLNALKASILSSMPFAEGTLLVKYLGVPLISSRLLYRDCKVLVEKLESRASVFILPVRIIHELEQLMRGLLWCHGEMKKGKAKVAWEAVCLPHREGGLGIRRLDDFNVALMTTHIWCILINKESLWVQWIYSYKLKGRSFWDVPCLGDVSWGWRKLLHIRNRIRRFIWHKINNGRPPCFSDTDSLRLRADVVDWYHVVWFPHCIPRHAIYMWLVTKEKLKTQDRLRQWDVRALTGTSSMPPRLMDLLAFLIPSKGFSVSNKKSTTDQIVHLITSLVRLKLVTFKFKKMTIGSHFLLDQWKIPSSCFDHDGSSSDDGNPSRAIIKQALRHQDYQDKECQRRLLASFQDDAKYEHVGQDTRSQDGKDTKINKEKDLKISELNTKSKDNDKGSRSKITKHEGTSLQQI